MKHNEYNNHVSSVISGVLVMELRNVAINNTHIREIADKCTERLIKQSTLEALILASVEDAKEQKKIKKTKVTITDNRA